VKVLSAFCLAVAVLSFPAAAQEAEVEPAEILHSVQQWMDENLDDNALDQLGIDAGRLRRFLEELRRSFDGSYVYDLSASREAALQLIPVLEKFEETQPYAIWLRTRLDYLEVADSLRREAEKKQPQSKTNGLPAPTPQMERSVWVRTVEKRPLPPRAEKYVPRLKEIFTAEKVPPQLVWIAEVESSFDPAARSPAGAAGLFQIMPATAKGLELSLWPWDERLNPEKSAKAAATYLRHLHRRFGDWRLALAAYNAGEGRVSGWLRKLEARTYDAIADRLPAETQMYVPKIEATLRKREGVTLEELKAPE
jgi:membrane-bound lytic murein transglycosylase D